MAKNLPPIDRRAIELADTGKYADFSTLEVLLMAEYGQDAVKRYRSNRELVNDINDLCERAQRKKARAEQQKGSS